MAGNKI